MTRDRLPSFSPRLLFLLGAAVLSSCGDDPRAVSGPGFDPDVAPPPGGAWFRPSVTTRWQWQLAGEIDRRYDVPVYDVDLFDTPPEVMAALAASGRRVICYFSAGSSEDWRADFGLFAAPDLGNDLDGWAGERWLDVTSERVLSVMLSRLDLAVAKGCAGVEPDNVDGYANDSGFLLTARHQLGYNRRLANEAHARGLAVLLKNDGDQAAALEPFFDGSLNEQCHEFDECGQLAPFVSAGKPVFNAEYADSAGAAAALAARVCPQALAESMRTLILPREVDDRFRVSCDEP